MYLIGLDVGSTGCKAIVFDADGNSLGSGYQEYGIETDHSGKAEQDANEIWRIAQEVLSQAVHASGQKAITAIAVSVQGDSSIPVDSNFNAISKAILGMDYRSASQAGRIAQEFGDMKLFKKSGMRSHPINAAVKTAWLKETSPEVYEQAYKIVTYADFILGKLGADPVIDYSMASRTGVFDLKTRDWSDELIQLFGLDREKFSTVQPSGRGVGTISPELADRIGISRDTLLVTGGHDQTCAGIGAGLVHEGPALLSTGTAEVLSTAFEKPKLTDTMYDSYYPCYIHAKPELYFTFSLNHVGGLLLKWYRDNVGQPEASEAAHAGKDPYDIIVGKIPTCPSKVMVLPHFNGSGTPWCDLNSMGAIVGLTMATTRHDIVRAILESQTYELRINIEYLRKAGIPISSLIAAGGGAKSKQWLQIRADILDRPVRTLRIGEAACLGAAILAGTAAEVYSSVDEGVEQTVHCEEEFTPDEHRLELYEDRYRVYRDLYPALKDLNMHLRGVVEG